MRKILTIAFLLVWIAVEYALLIHIVERAQAVKCARTTEDFSDSSIMKCFIERGLPCPEHICHK